MGCGIIHLGARKSRETAAPCSWWRRFRAGQRARNAFGGDIGSFCSRRRRRWSCPKQAYRIPQCASPGDRSTSPPPACTVQCNRDLRHHDSPELRRLAEMDPDPRPATGGSPRISNLLKAFSPRRAGFSQGPPAKRRRDPPKGTRDGSFNLAAMMDLSKALTRSRGSGRISPPGVLIVIIAAVRRNASVLDTEYSTTPCRVSSPLPLKENGLRHHDLVVRDGSSALLQ